MKKFHSALFDFCWFPNYDASIEYLAYYPHPKSCFYKLNSSFQGICQGKRYSAN